MTNEELARFHASQMDIVKQNRAALSRQGYIKGYEDIYPDIWGRLGKKRGTAYIRGSVSLKLMAILYDTLAVFIPPLSKEVLEQRFFLKWEELVKLCQQGIIIPILGEASRYTAPHFDVLFKELPTEPCSLWARGLGVLDIFQMQDSLEEARRILPLGEIVSDEQILADVAKNYRDKDETYLKERVAYDAAVMYADLCIFGCKKDAESLLAYSPKEIFHNLKLLNEIKTYPILFGLEGQGNFEISKIQELSTVPVQMNFPVPESIPQHDLEILFRGIGIDVDNIHVQDIINYHNDQVGRKVRNALEEFNDFSNQMVFAEGKADSSLLMQRAELFQKKLNEAITDLNSYGYYNKMDKATDLLEKVFKIGAVTFGCVFAFDSNCSQLISVASLAATGGILISAIPETVANVIVEHAAGSFSPFVSNMWSAKKLLGKRG